YPSAGEQTPEYAPSNSCSKTIHEIDSHVSWSGI
ncbi:MAG: hypothetical protein ACI97B_004810, partial [Verrucomicrobiales bacterium]